jgi:AmmeMemoRadiSam system protein B/AmmeMemoRadiSam system protein A
MAGLFGMQKPQDTRPMAVAGQFYPDDPQELRTQLKEFFRAYSSDPDGRNVRALIVPHAGYVFSGEVAASAYACLPASARYDRVFLIGPSHRASFEGASVDTGFDACETPLGRVRIDSACARNLVKQDSVFSYVPAAHLQEHCLEVQVPFLQERLPEVPPLVPILIGTQRIFALRKIAEALRPYWNERNLFVISSDFSHYPAYDAACEADKRVADAILTGNLDAFGSALVENDQAAYPGLQTSACGQCAIAVLLMLMQESEQDIEKTAYRNSGDSPYGGKSGVVGYNAFVIRDKVSETFSLSPEDRQELLRIARQTLEQSFGGPRNVDTTPVSDALKTPCGAFVTLRRNGNLRGCIGTFGEDIPLYRLVGRMARSAAFDDPRFPPLQKSELPEIEIEISVLTPLRRIHSIDEFHYGREGIYIVKGGRSGTFLPQVAEEVNWTKEEFLGHCARDKAGIGWEGWKDAELYTYEAIVFGE